ncbi:MAG: hypothetical protein DMF08_12810 [Verrucomicrobia bacterium]|nr:MAG: hypothetical protein DMF08_12810 [Verrucomicrobiota bacterium]
MEIATYGVGLFTPTILRSIEISERTRGLAARDFALAEGSAIIDLFLPIGFLLRVWTIPRFGRIRMQAIGLPTQLRGTTGGFVGRSQTRCDLGRFLLPIFKQNSGFRASLELCRL